MAFKTAVFVSLLAVAACNPILPYAAGPGPIAGGYAAGPGPIAGGYAAGGYAAGGYAHGPVAPELPAKYAFGYAVADPHTGDFKSQSETADGHTVKGVYTMLEADGTKRVVEYADFGQGFNAIVKKEGVPAPAPVAQAAPIAGHGASAGYGYAPVASYAYGPSASYGYGPSAAYGYGPAANYGYGPAGYGAYGSH